MAKEYIEREEVVDALNKALFAYEDETEARFKKDPELDISEWFFHRVFVQRMNEIDIQTILNIPAADVVEVVRCKDCKYSDSDCIVEDMLWCNNRNSPDYAVTKDFFCADGERQEVDDG